MLCLLKGLLYSLLSIMNVCNSKFNLILMAVYLYRSILNNLIQDYTGHCFHLLVVVTRALAERGIDPDLLIHFRGLRSFPFVNGKRKQSCTGCDCKKVVVLLFTN